MIISSTFFPDPGVSAIRMTQWCRYLPTLGWQPRVVCRYYGYEATKENLSAQVHPNVSVTYLGMPKAQKQLFGLARLERGLTRKIVAGVDRSFGTLAVPDISVLSWRRFQQQILARFHTIRPELILTTSPPHSVHTIGLWLSRKTGIPWVADFRDPYLIDSRFKPRGLGLLRLRSHQKFLSSIYDRAGLITHAIPLQARWSRKKYPAAANRIKIIENGFPSEMLGYSDGSEYQADGRKTVLVAGTIPEPQLYTLAQAVAELVRDGLCINLVLIGKIPGTLSKLKKLLGKNITVLGYLSHSETVQHIASADVLVNYLDEERKKALLLSTKLIEYLATGKPVICVNPSRSDKLLLRRQRRAVKLFNPSTSILAFHIRKALEYSADLCPEILTEFRTNFIWERQVATLADSLNNLIEFRSGISSTHI